MGKLEVAYFSPEDLQRYREPAQHIIAPAAQEAAELFRSLGIRATANDWLLQQEWKRALAVPLFLDLLQPGPPRRILEIGGGLSALTLALARRHDYTLIELATHEEDTNYRKLEALLGRPFVVVSDWQRVQPTPQDLIIANDLFPNVDQRLYELVDQFLPWTRELRLTLTYYERTAWPVRRMSSGEALMVRPWGLREISSFLDHLCACPQIGADGYDRSQLKYQDLENVLFTNRRNILRLQVITDCGGSDAARPTRQRSLPGPVGSELDQQHRCDYTPAPFVLPG
jgi:hypothetical protein